MTRNDDPRLNGRSPEFARMSRRPGIGVFAMDDVADVLLRFNLVSPQGDVPSSLRHGSREMPLGRFLRGKLRERVGLDAKAPESTRIQMVEEMRPMLLASKTDPDAPSLARQVVKANAGKVARFEARQKIYNRKRAL